MQEQPSESIMPLSEALVKELSDLFEQQNKKQIPFYCIELTAYQRLAAFSPRLMAGVHRLCFGRGYAGPYRDCPAWGETIQFQLYSRRLISSFGPLS